MNKKKNTLSEKLTNEEILVALKTKEEDLKNNNISDKKGAIFSKIDKLNIQVYLEDNYSEQGYITIVNPETKRDLVISKDGWKKTRVYGNGRYLGSANKAFSEVSKKIDFVGYLNKPIPEARKNNQSKVDTFKILKFNEKSYETMTEKALKKMESAQKEYEEALENLKGIRESLEKIRKRS